MKNKKTALFLTFLLPGLGHLYLKKIFDGLVFSATTIFIWIVEFYMSQAFSPFQGKAFFVTGGLIFLYIYAIVDIIRLANKLK